jgi:hypothetical protein
MGNFSFSFIFYSIRGIKLRAWANFQVCWCFSSFYKFINSVKIQIFCGSRRFVIGWKLGRIIACKLGNFSFSFIFYSIRRIKLRVWANFQVCWCVFFFFFLILCIYYSVEIQFFLVPAGLWLAATLGRIISCKQVVSFHLSFIQFFV